MRRTQREEMFSVVSPIADILGTGQVGSCKRRRHLFNSIAFITRITLVAAASERKGGAKTSHAPLSRRRWYECALCTRLAASRTNNMAAGSADRTAHHHPALLATHVFF